MDNDLWAKLTRTWRADMVEAREAFAAGERSAGHHCLRRAAIARRWVGEDLRGIRKAISDAEELKRRNAEIKRLTARLFRMEETHDARKRALLQQIAALRLPLHQGASNYLRVA